MKVSRNCDFKYDMWLCYCCFNEYNDSVQTISTRLPSPLLELNQNSKQATNVTSGQARKQELSMLHCNFHLMQACSFQMSLFLHLSTTHRTQPKNTTTTLSPEDQANKVKKKKKDKKYNN